MIETEANTGNRVRVVLSCRDNEGANINDGYSSAFLVRGDASTTQLPSLLERTLHYS